MMANGQVRMMLSWSSTKCRDTATQPLQAGTLWQASVKLCAKGWGKAAVMEWA